LVFGRQENCDVAIDDHKMSQQHFRIRRAHHHFVLEDLRSTNGTLLDGQRTGWGELKDGARISAGRTRILVRFIPRVGGGKPGAPLAANQPKPKYQVEELPDRGLLYSSVGAQPPIDKFLTGLAGLCPMGLLVDAMVRDKIQSKLPPDSAPLYDYMDPASAEIASPVLIASEAAIPITTELAEADGWVAYFGEGSSKEMLARLRSFAHPPELNEAKEAPPDSGSNGSQNAPPTDAPPVHPKSICVSRPSILVELARHGDAGFLDRLLTDWKAVVMEGAEADTWRAFAKEGFQKALTSLGFMESTEEEVAKE
jgi:pSer/pThr/pTyr-binding forkhead associated (FHA) protein